MNSERKARANRSTIGIIVVLVVAALVVGVVIRQPAETAVSLSGNEEEMMSATQGPNRITKEAIFAGGCFWCIESVFELMPGVVEAVSGYTGGSVVNPTYAQVSSGQTGHFEAVLVKYDPEQITYEALLDRFWRSIDPTDAGGQFHDRGSQYFTAVFYVDEAQRELADASKQRLNELGVFEDPIVTQVLPAQAFYPAEDYHQDYFRTCAVQYNAYNKASGRKTYLEKTWDEQN